jgi:hypothetical protein
LTTSNQQIRLIVQHILEQLLSNSIIFQHDPDEVLIWLDSLPQIPLENTSVEKSNGQAAVLQFLGDCFVLFLKDPSLYINDLNRVVNNINKRIQDMMSAYNNELTKKNSVQFEDFQDMSTYSNTSYPFSPLIVTLVRNYENVIDNKIAITSFLHILFKKLFTKQPLAYYLDEYIEQLENNIGFKNIKFLEYIGKWEINEFFSSLKYISNLYKHPNENSLNINKVVDIPVIISEISQKDLNILNQNLTNTENSCLEILKGKNG